MIAGDLTQDAKTVRRRKSLPTTAFALCAFSAHALAAAPPPYAVVDIGYTSIGRETAGLDDAGVQTTDSDRRDTGYAITLGWRFSPHLAAEGSFIEMGEGRYDVAVPNGGTVSNGTIRVRSSGVLLSLAGTWPLHDRLSLEGRAGAYLGKTETRLRGVMSNPLVGNQAFDNLLESDSKIGLAAGVGAVAAFSERWALRLGYDYLDSAFGADAGRISLGVRFNWP